jgi:nitroimidazol reductase NimA-like FMN-containing flavoprotein (pyridoxamine 5'-phosphate oxidase superfamily)
MLGELTRAEIEQVMLRETVGRIGCHADGRTYVVPVTYAYDGECVYGHTRDGLKVRTLRANSAVCFEVEQIEDLAHWRTVIAWGTYEELGGRDEERAIALLRARFGSGLASETSRPRPILHDAVMQTRTIAFRLRLDKKTGRFER